MGRKHEFIKLKDSEVDQLTSIVNKGIHRSKEIKRAMILLLNHEGKTSSEVVEAVKCAPLTFYNIINKYKAGGLEEALKDKPRTGRPPVYTGSDRAKVTALACTDAPDGYTKWTVRLLAEKMVELGYLDRDSICHTTIHRILKKMN